MLQVIFFYSFSLLLSDKTHTVAGSSTSFITYQLLASSFSLSYYSVKSQVVVYFLLQPLELAAATAAADL